VIARDHLHNLREIGGIGRDRAANPREIVVIAREHLHNLREIGVTKGRGPDFL